MELIHLQQTLECILKRLNPKTEKKKIKKIKAELEAVKANNAKGIKAKTSI